MSYLCIDVGSSSLKAAVVSEAGRFISIARRPLSLDRGADGASETDANRWISMALSAGAEAIYESRRAEPGSGPRAIAVSGNGPTLLAADASGGPLGPALSWLDRRASAEAVEVSALAGMTIDPTFYLPKALRTWRLADADHRRRIRWFFSCPEYLEYALCGEAVTYLPHPGYEPYIWNPSMIASLGLPPELFPPFAAPATVAGRLLEGPARTLGLDPGLPVVVGFPDFLAAIVGSGAVDVGVACDRTGTSEAINICAGRPFPTRALFSLPHPIDGLWNVSGGVSTAGAALEWISSAMDYPRSGNTVNDRNEAQLSAGGYGVVDLLDDAMLAEPGAKGLAFLPYLSGERAPLWDPARRGAFVGLTVGHGRPEIARAVCESLGFGLKLAADLAVGAGMPFSLLRVTGQAAANDFLCALKADILGVPVEAPEFADAELAGDAAACAVALGDLASLGEAGRLFYRPRRRFEPHVEVAYRAGYAHFKDALAALASVDRSAFKDDATEGKRQ